MEYNKNINEIGKKYIINSYYTHHGSTCGNSNIKIIDNILKYIVSDEKIIEYKKLCKSIFINKSNTNIVFYDYYHRYQYSPLLTTYIKDISYYLQINYINSDIYYENKTEYLNGVKLKKDYRFVIIYINKDNKSKLPKMIKEFEKLDIKNMLIVPKSENILQNIYKCKIDEFERAIFTMFKDEMFDILINARQFYPVLESDTLIMHLKNNFIHWIGQPI